MMTPAARNVLLLLGTPLLLVSSQLKYLFVSLPDDEGLPSPISGLETHFVFPSRHHRYDDNYTLPSSSTTVKKNKNHTSSMPKQVDTYIHHLGDTEKSNYNGSSHYTTIVTAYYPLKTRRHTPSDYIEFLSRLLSCHDPIIFFTSSDFVSQIKNISKMYRHIENIDTLRIIPLELNETSMLSSDIISPQRWKDVAKRMGHKQMVDDKPKTSGQGNNKNSVTSSSKNYGHEIFQLWNTKVEFLKHASDLNPFQSSFFTWVDAGMIRWDRYTNTRIVQRIPPELPPTKMMLMNVTPILGYDRQDYKQYLQIAAGIFGGYKPAIDTFFWAYTNELEKVGNSRSRYKQDLLASEQKIMYRCCMRYPGLCFVVQATKLEKKKRRSTTDDERSKLVEYYGLGLKYAYFYMLPFLNYEDYQKMKHGGYVKNYTLP